MNATKVVPNIVKLDEEVVFVNSLNLLDSKVRGLIGSYDVSLNEVEQLQNPASKRLHAKDLDAKRNEADNAERTAKAALESTMQDLNTAAEDFLHGVYVLASRRQNPAIFYGKSSNSLASARELDANHTPEDGKARRDEEQQALDGIDGVAISSGDTVKEINRLLDLASTKRMAEEMDIVTYQSNAKRLFDRVQDEFNQALVFFTADQVRVRKMLKAIENFTSKSTSWITDPLAADATVPLETGAPVSAKPAPTSGARSILAADPEFIAATRALVTAYHFLVRYDKFLDHAKGYAGNVGSEFYTEASVDAFKDATREHAQRIEKTGLFSSYLTLGMGMGSALIVVIILVFLDNNLAFKNWIIPLTGAAAAVGYFMSVMFGRCARDGIMGDLRGALFESVSRTSYGPQKGTTSQEAGRDADNYFKFPRLEWTDFDQPVTSNETSAVAKDSSTSLATTLTDVGKNKWPVRVSAMKRGNWAILAAVIFVTASISCLSGNPGWRKTFAFISRTDDLGSCVLERGRVLMATGNSYFIATRDSRPVAEVAKSLVLRIEPIQFPTPADADAIKKVSADLLASTERVDKLPSCDKPRAETPDQVGATKLLAESIKGGLSAVADKLGTGQDNPTPLANLAGATKDLAGNVKTGLDAVAGKLGTVQTDPVSLAALVAATSKLADSLKEGLEAVAERIPQSSGCPCGTTSAAAPIVVPITIDLPPAPPGAPEAQAGGPTFITQVYTADGKVYDYGKGVMLLPIFLDPVTANGDERFGGKNLVIDTLQEAFFFGATSLDDPTKPGVTAKLKLLHEIASGYAACMIRAKEAFVNAGSTGTPPRLSLLVEGYASEKWEAAQDAGLKNDLNLYLAEGRRYAVIQALGLSDPSIEIKHRPKKLALEGWKQVDTKAVKDGFQFDNYDAMKAALIPRIPGGNSDPNAQVDMLGRSVVISVDGEPPQQCRRGAG